MIDEDLRLKMKPAARRSGAARPRSCPALPLLAACLLIPACRPAAGPAASAAPVARSSSPAALPHPRFSASRIAALQPGLSSAQVEVLFGPPDRRVSADMGLDTSVPWKALVYEYDMSRTEGGRLVRNELVFDAGTEPPLLDHYNIPQSYSNEQVPEYAAVPAEVALGLPGLPDAVSAACADALELVGADACYRTMDELQYWRYARTMSQAGQWASRNVAFITGAAQDEWHTAARKSLMGCYAALAGHVYGQPPDDEFVDMAARPIPDWVRGQCQGRWWTPTPDAAIVERIASYEVIRNEGGGQAAGAAAMQQRCAKLRPPEGQRESAQVAAWAGCTNCDAAILDYVFGVWPAKGETLAQMVQQSCHDATVSIADSDAQTLVNAIIAEVESGKAQGVDRTAAAARGASEQAALKARLAELDALPPDDAGMDPRQARLRRRARLLECGSAVIDYVYR